MRGLAGLDDCLGAQGLPGAQGLLADFFLRFFAGAQGLDGPQGLAAELFSAFTAGASAAKTAGAGVISAEATSKADSVDTRCVMGLCVFFMEVPVGLCG